ncbi:MAG: DUF2157 domain-containing protein [Chloroflexi bacterium]|nr:DUF2157 domain-containing protein [Chloroflexota bacterium]
MAEREREEPTPTLQERWAAFWQYLKGYTRRLVIIEGVLLAVLIGGYLLTGRRDADELSMVMLFVGVLIFGVGAYSVVGGWGQTRSWNYQYIQSMNPDKIHERANQDAVDMQQNWGLIVPGTILGGVTIIIGVLIQAFFR